MNRTVIQIGQSIWIKCGDTHSYWEESTAQEVASALEYLDSRAKESNVHDMAGHFDNWNLAAVTREDRRFRRIAYELEGK